MESLCRGESPSTSLFTRSLQPDFPLPSYRFQEQAISRSYRIGQTLPVHVFRLVVKDSIEESIENVRSYFDLVIISFSLLSSFFFPRLKFSNAK